MSSATSLSGASAIACRNLVIGHGRRALLPPIDIEIARAELLLVLGRNGSGKTTFLKTLLGVIPPLDGAVTLTPNLRMAFVPQSSEIDRIVPIRARDLVAWGVVHGRSGFRPFLTRAERAKVDAALEQAGAAPFAAARFSELSGGQKQRVLFARLIASGADVVVLDEPTAAMDVAAEREAYGRIVAFAREQGRAVVVVTHAIGLAAASADRVLFFDRSDGAEAAIVAVGTPREIFGRGEVTRLFGEVHLD